MTLAIALRTAGGLLSLPTVKDGTIITMPFPQSARHGMKWWEIDMTWMMIQVLQFLGLAWKVSPGG